MGYFRFRNCFNILGEDLHLRLHHHGVITYYCEE